MWYATIARTDGRARLAGLQTLVVLIFQTRQPRGEPLDRRLELGVEVKEVAEPLGQPLETHRLRSAPLREFLDASVRKVHVSASAEPPRSGPAARRRASWSSRPPEPPRPAGRCGAGRRPPTV